MKKAVLVITLLSICIVTATRAYADSKGAKLTKAEIVNIGTTYEGILKAKNELYRFLGGQPLGEYNADGFDTLAGESELIKKYNKYLILSQFINAAGPFASEMFNAEQKEAYREAIDVLKQEGVMDKMDAIIKAQDELNSKIDAISERGVSISSSEEVYRSYLKLKTGE